MGSFLVQVSGIEKSHQDIDVQQVSLHHSFRKRMPLRLRDARTSFESNTQQIGDDLACALVALRRQILGGSQNVLFYFDGCPHDSDAVQG